MYSQPIQNCICGKKPKLLRNDYNYYSYACNKCNLRVFFSRDELCAREAFNAMINNISKLKVKI